MIRWMRYKIVYLIISTVVIGAGVISLVKWGLVIGVDFKGGTIAEFHFTTDVSTEEVTHKLEEKGVGVASIQHTQTGTYLFRLQQVDEEKRNTIHDVLKSVDPDYEEYKFETVGPAIGPELVKKTAYALAISAGAIMLWIWIQFKSATFGISAILAMFHDSLVVVGVYSLLGHFFGAEVDFLFVTGVLTILSFSVHDTIVVYDRIREMHKRTGLPVNQLADEALSETMVRSLNNSLTVVFMLLALVLLGGSSVRWFAVTLLIGTISGTYSSPFVAVPILITLQSLRSKLKRKN